MRAGCAAVIVVQKQSLLATNLFLDTAKAVDVSENKGGANIVETNTTLGTEGYQNPDTDTG